MKKILQFLKSRLINHWQTTLVAVLLVVGYFFLYKGKIDYEDFTNYLILIPSVILLLMKDFKKDEPK